VQEHEEAGGAAEETPKKKGWLSGIVGAVKTVGRCVQALSQNLLNPSGKDANLTLDPNNFALVL
jgi:hypothetical protein